MTNWIYGTKIDQEGSDYRATVRDLPEVLTFGATRAEALANALDAIDAVVAHRMEKSTELALPSKVKRGEEPVELPLRTAAKAGLYRAWLASGLSKREVAKRMKVGETEVRRILDPRHGTKIEAMDAAARVLGSKMKIEFEPA
ncbi:MAG: type II toxin-antitoxin system HicB family antitoxin [Hyphomicrobiales bacterium]|nr:type II toxin-antitoxin system HicB family antitoxin [Hyphomicrobiales bacterium]